MDNAIPVYESKNYRYIRISDIGGYEARELEAWVKGKTQPLIQGEGKGVREIQDAVFYEDYLLFLDYKAGKHVFID